MAIPVYLQQFKAAGVYRVVFDKSTMTNVDTEVLRLVVGFSEKGPFNIPVYVKDPQTFTQLYGGISKKLEKRGVYFHRLALQMLQSYPIICLNLKKFDGETLEGSIVDTTFNPTFKPIETVTLNVEDIYDTTRFWELDAEKLIEMNTVDGRVMDKYINLSMTDTKANSVSYFIRKASGMKVSQYNITVSDWYSTGGEEMPEYLSDYRNNLISDFFAEIYVFEGKFNPSQVLASNTLKNYFTLTGNLDDDNEYQLQLREKVYDAYGKPADTLDELYFDSTSHAIGRWCGALIPDFKDKQGYAQSLDVLFNLDNDLHHMMMAFNTDMLEEGTTTIDLSGRSKIPTESSVVAGVVLSMKDNKPDWFDLNKIYEGSATTTLMSNENAPIIADTLSFSSSALVIGTEFSINPLYTAATRITGSLFVAELTGLTEDDYETNVEDLQTYINHYSQIADDSDDLSTPYYIRLYQLASTGGDSAVIHVDQTGSASDVENTYNENIKTVTIYCSSREQLLIYAARLGVGVLEYDTKFDAEGKLIPKKLDLNYGHGTFFPSCKGFEAYNAFMDTDDPMRGPEQIITSITKLEPQAQNKYYDYDCNLKASKYTVNIRTSVSTTGSNNNPEDSVYGASVTFIKASDNWEYGPITINGMQQYCLHTIIKEDEATDDILPIWDRTLTSVLHKGDCLLAEDATVDNNQDGEITTNYIWDGGDADYFYDNVYVNEVGTAYFHELDKEVKAGKRKQGEFKCHYIILSGEPSQWEYMANYDGIDSTDLADSQIEGGTYFVRIDAPLNQEIGRMVPQYLEGYTYKNSRPNGTDMLSKVQWHDFLLSALSDYKGLRRGLLNKSDVDYRYVIDTFESYPIPYLKKELSMLCKEKQSAFCIANFPPVRNFVKCPYTSFTDNNGVFDINYVVAGYNKRKPAIYRFSLPTDNDGASFIAFYSPLKFSDGYTDIIIPSAGLVSNLFIDKYLSRQPYYIVAGPNYGHIVAEGLVGPDYKYSTDELHVIEPYGVNCMVYRPGFGTFINANQTAKQTPVSALSKVNVRELVIYLQDEIEKVLQSYQWEFNNEITRNAILDRANQICSLIAANGGIQAYRNVMDESNNTPEIIDNEMAVLSTMIEPGFGCGKMIQELTLYRTGQMEASITE